MSEPTTVSSVLLGAVPVAPPNVFAFPQGLPGFPDARSFALLAAAYEGVYWLQSMEFPALCLLLVDPFASFPGHYRIDLTAEDLVRIGTHDASNILVLAIVTLPPKQGGRATVNLRAPILFNIDRRHAFQSIRPDEGFGVQEPVDLSLLATERGK